MFMDSRSATDTAPVRPGEELNWKALEAYLREHLPSKLAAGESISDAGPDAAGIEVEQFPGGHSNLTYCVRFGDREFVMRRPPFGPVAPTAHDMPREYRLLAAIHPHFRLAPEPYLLCEDTSIIGAPFYLMERRKGIVVRQAVPPEIGDDLDLRRRVSESLVDTLASLHAVDIQSSGLINIGKPAGFVKRQVEGWAGRWDRSRTSDLPEMTESARWLIDRLPPDPERPTLVHNDYKLDNVMLDPGDPARVVAILDWEMCTVGDPLIDVGLLLCYWPQADDPELFAGSLRSVTMLPGWLKRAEIIERYAERSGRDLSNIGYYHIFALFKLAVVIQQIYYRYHVGQTNDARFADFDKRVAALAKMAHTMIQSQ
ncbi:MAG: phosphotransferase family protein [Acidobacteria bacterium]|nr:phosphotransferase family protein [Acidobacteriota bacterium]